jgi:nickel transport protein
MGFAHKVNIFAWVDSDTIYTESYFHDGEFVRNGKIEVRNSSGEVVHKGVTDENGKHHFKIPLIDTLTLILDTSMGHRATLELSADELKDFYGSGKGESRESDKSFHELEANDNSNYQNVDIDDIRAVVRDEVSRQLKPIKRDIAELKAKRRMSAQEIFAGIGYLLGLMGIVMYFKSKGKK